MAETTTTNSLDSKQPELPKVNAAPEGESGATGATKTPQAQEAGKPTGRLSGLKALKNNRGRKPKASTGRPSKEEQAEAAAQADAQTRAKVEQEYEKIADGLLADADKWCVERGLTPINPIQKTFIKVGLVGTLMKYGINIDKYPELALAGGVAWVAADKFRESRRLKARPVEPVKAEDTESKVEQKKKGFFS